MRLLLKIMPLLAVASSVYAYSITNIQYLYGDFSGKSGFDTSGGAKHTVTVENFTAHEYGDFFWFCGFYICR